MGFIWAPFYRPHPSGKAEADWRRGSRADANVSSLSSLFGPILTMVPIAGGDDLQPGTKFWAASQAMGQSSVKGIDTSRSGPGESHLTARRN